MRFRPHLELIAFGFLIAAVLVVLSVLPQAARMAIVPEPAAAWPVGAGYQPFTLTDNASTRLHAMWVEDNYSTVYDAGAENASQIDRERTFGNFKARLAAAGIELHVYTWSQLNADTARLWRNAGKPRDAANATGGGYALAFMPYWHEDYGFRHNGDATSTGWIAKFFRADSTSVQMIHLGNGSNVHGLADNGFGPTDAVGIGLAGNGVTYATDTTLRVAATGDSFFYTRMPSKVKQSFLPTGAAQMVRLFSSTGREIGDTVCTVAGEKIYGAYRIYYTNQGNALVTTPHTDFVLGGDGISGANSMQAPILWALAARYLTLPPMECAMSWNDHGEFGSNPRYLLRAGTPWSLTNVANWARPRATYLDSIVADICQRYGVCKGVVGGQADSTAALFASFPEYANARTWPGWRWGVHYHTRDTTSSMRRAFGGGANNFDTTGTVPSNRVVANRLEPGNATTALRYGVAQTLAANDAMFRSLGLQTSGFMLPGNDQLMPVGWKDFTPGAIVCPAESLFETLASTGHNVVSNFPAGTTDVLAPITNVRLGSPTAASSRWQIYPQEKYTTASGKEIKLVGYTVISSNQGGKTGTPPNDVLDQGGPLSRTAVLGFTTQTVNLLMGFSAFRMGNSRPALQYGQTSVTWAQNVDQGRFAIAGWHVNFVGNDPMGFYNDYYWQEIGYLKTIKALEKLVDASGNYKIIEWKYPEDLD